VGWEADLKFGHYKRCPGGKSIRGAQPATWMVGATKRKCRSEARPLQGQEGVREKPQGEQKALDLRYRGKESRAEARPLQGQEGIREKPQGEQMALDLRYRGKESRAKAWHLQGFGIGGVGGGGDFLGGGGGGCGVAVEVGGDAAEEGFGDALALGGIREEAFIGGVADE